MLGRQAAQKHCANWSNGRCDGCMMKVKKGSLTFKIDSSLFGKKCLVAKGKECSYFNYIVVPGIAQ